MKKRVNTKVKEKAPFKESVGERSASAFLPGLRLPALQLVFVLLAIVLVGRIALLQVIPDYDKGFNFLQMQGDARSMRELAIPASRGMILDREGRPLAISTPVVSVWTDGQFLKADELDISALAALLDMPVDQLQRKIASVGDRRFAYIKRSLSPAVESKLESFYDQGIFVLSEFRRYYPAGEVAAQLVGLTNIDDVGQEGTELTFDSQLAGMPGVRQIERDREGRAISSAKVIQPAVAGLDIKLTIDLRLQYLAYRALKDAVTLHQADSASLVMLDVHSGEVLAMVSQPSYNPNTRQDYSAAASKNRALVDWFEPGSTVKPFTVLAALESGLYDINSEINTSPGTLLVGSKLVKDPVDYGVLTVAQVLEKSSQVGTSKIALELEPEFLREVFARVGLGQGAATGFRGERSGRLPEHYDWKPIEAVTLAYGYGLSVTGLELARAYAAIGNGGMLVEPKLFADMSVPSGSGVASPQDMSDLRETLKAVVGEGTGSAAALEGYSVGGKTGTTHQTGNGIYLDHAYNALFAGLIPANNPQIAMVVVVNGPKGDDYSGGRVAAPIFGAVADHALRELGIAPQQADIIAKSSVQVLGDAG